MRWLVLGAIAMTLSTMLNAAVYSDTAVIDYARHLDVSKLDARLSARGLEEWLKEGPAHVDQVTWSISDCDLRSNSEKPTSKRTLCVRFGFRRGATGGWGIVTVGSVAKGIQGQPRFESAQVTCGPPNQIGRTTKTLSAIPALLDEVAASKRTHR